MLSILQVDRDGSKDMREQAGDWQTPAPMASVEMVVTADVDMAQLWQVSEAQLGQVSEAQLGQVSEAQLWQVSEAQLWQVSEAQLWQVSKVQLRQASEAQLWQVSEAQLQQVSEKEMLAQWQGVSEEALGQLTWRDLKDVQSLVSPAASHSEQCWYVVATRGWHNHKNGNDTLLRSQFLLRLSPF